MGQRLGFMFAGQGAQAVGMGRELAQASDAANELFTRADKLLGCALSDLCFNGPEETLRESRICQPAIYVMSLACLAAVRECMAAQPTACGGLSLGEFAALTSAGVLTFDDGLRLVAERGRLMQEACRATDGAMAAVLTANTELVERVCADADVDVANYNCPGQVVISGERAKVQTAVATLEQEGDVSRTVMLNVAGAYHSRLMAPAAEAFGDVLDTTSLAKPVCPVAQNAAGELVTDPERIRAHLKAQVTGSVRWEQCVRAMMNAGAEHLVEFGPGRVLTGFMKRIDRRFQVSNVATPGDVAKLAEKADSE